jgi:hypothetical protein
VKILLAQGANVNSNRGWLGTPLRAVLERGMEEMAMVLIQSAGIDASVTGGYYGSALQITCTNLDPMRSRALKAMLEKVDLQISVLGRMAACSRLLLIGVG